jgi:hypothetical protein
MPVQVWNPARIIRLPGGRPPDVYNFDSVERAMWMLETNASFRAAFFAQPILVPTAGAWLSDWCSRVGNLFVRALRAHELLGRGQRSRCRG